MKNIGPWKVRSMIIITTFDEIFEQLTQDFFGVKFKPNVQQLIFVKITPSQQNTLNSFNSFSSKENKPTTLWLSSMTKENVVI